MAPRRRWFDSAAVAAFLLIHSLSGVVGAPSPSPGAEGFGYANRQSLRIGSTVVTVFYGGPIVYVIGKNPASLRDYGARFVRLRLVTEAPIVQERFLKVGDQTVEIAYESSDPNIVTVRYISSMGQHWVEFTGEVGTATLTIRARNTRLDVALETRRIPVGYDDRSEDIVRVIGMPDKIDKYSVPWPQSQIVNFVYYSATSPYTVSGEHWQYRKFPGALLDIQNGKLFQIYNMGWGVY